MLDTMTVNKLVGGFCGAFLLFLLGNWLAEAIYHPGAAKHGADGEKHAQGYVIDIGAVQSPSDSTLAQEAEEIDISAMLATADIARGEKVFKKCKACHKVADGANGTGPHLYKVVGRGVSAVENFKYSAALAKAADIWTPEALNGFLENPKKYAKGTKMAFAGLKKLADRVDVIAYLNTIGAE